MIPIEFALFFLGVFTLYWGVPARTAGMQNGILLIASLAFYARADWRFFGLIIASIAVNYSVGLGLQSARSRQKSLLFYSGIAINLGILLYFKYAHFFADRFAPRLSADPQTDLIHSPALVLLPLGISFYTFQAIGYLVDLYREEVTACRNICVFALYLAYFGKITAGPIERYEPFSRQLAEKRVFDYHLAAEGMRQILWGLFAKLVIAGNCAFIAEPILTHHADYPGSTLLLGAFFYVFEVFGDFSGYSNIAIGASKLLGIRLSKNFAAPFFAGNIREFWSRWHMSLTSWMTHYVYTPLSFYLRRFRTTGIIVSTIVTFLLIGIWHGGNLTFLLFGGIHAFYFSIYILGAAPATGQPAPATHRQGMPGWLKPAGLFVLVMMALIAFGALTVKDALQTWRTIFSTSLFSTPVMPELVSPAKMAGTTGCIVFLLLVEWRQQKQATAFSLPGVSAPALRSLVYLFVMALILLLGSTVHSAFIYSQF